VIRLLENVVTSWVMDRLPHVGRPRPRPLARIAGQALRRKRNSYRPRTYARRKTRAAIRRWL